MIDVAKNLSSVIPIMELWLKLVTENQTISIVKVSLVNAKTHFEEGLASMQDAKAGNPRRLLGYFESVLEHSKNVK